MVKNKKITLILSLLLCALMAFGIMGVMGVNKASAAGYPFKYDETTAVEDDKMKKYYVDHWELGQDNRAGDEASGTWSFGKAILHTDSQTYSYVKATHDTSYPGGDTKRYSTDAPHQFMYGFEVLTDIVSGNTSTSYQSVFAWTAEDAGTVKFTGFYSRRIAKETSLVTLASASGYTDFWLPGINSGDTGFGFTTGESYTTGMFKYSPNATGNKLSCLNYQNHTSEYLWAVDPNQSYDVQAGDIIFFGLLCTDGGTLTDGWSTNTLALFSSDFTGAQCKLAVSQGENGTVSGVENNQIFSNKETVTASISANEGYVIDTLTWGGQTISAAIGQKTYSLNEQITADTTLAVTFKKATYAVSVSNDTEKGSVTGVTNGQVVTHGDTVTVQVTPLAGYEIASVKWNNVDVTDSFNKAGFSFSRTVTSTSDLQVVYQKITYVVTVTANANQGSVTGVTSGTAYDMNESLTITVTPKPGYIISSVKWNGADVTVSNNAGFNFTKEVTEITTLEVVYEALMFNVTVNNQGNYGTITGVESGEYAMDTQLEITIVPNAGYQILSVKWGSSWVTVSNALECTFVKTVTEAVTLEVAYVKTNLEPEIEEYQVSVQFNSKMGNVTGIQAQKYQAGEMLTVKITAKAGYEIKSITWAGGDIRFDEDEKTSCTTTVTVTEASTLKVTFGEYVKDPNKTEYENGAACLNTINGSEYIGLGAVILAVAGLVVVKLTKKEN